MFRPALDLAVQKKNTDLIELLLEKGADIDGNPCCRPEMRSQPLAKAVLLGHYDIARYLIIQGANINAKQGSRSILTLSILDKNWPFARFLVEQGVDLRESSYLCTALLQGADITFIALLLEHGASIEMNDNVNRDAMRCAEIEQREDAIQLFKRIQP